MHRVHLHHPGWLSVKNRKAAFCCYRASGPFRFGVHGPPALTRAVEIHLSTTFWKRQHCREHYPHVHLLAAALGFSLDNVSGLISLPLDHLHLSLTGGPCDALACQAWSGNALLWMPRRVRLHIVLLIENGGVGMAFMYIMYGLRLRPPIEHRQETIFSPRKRWLFLSS